MRQDEVVQRHHQFNGHEYEQTPGDSEGQGSLACCSPWGCRVRHDLETKQQHHDEGGPRFSVLKNPLPLKSRLQKENKQTKKTLNIKFK